MAVVIAPANTSKTVPVGGQNVSMISDTKFGCLSLVRTCDFDFAASNGF